MLDFKIPQHFTLSLKWVSRNLLWTFLAIIFKGSPQPWLFTYIFFKSFSLNFFIAWKSCKKRPSPAKSVITAFCSRVAGRHPSVGCYLPTNPFILFLGGAELLQLATRYSERLTSSQTVLATCSKNRMGFVCDFDGAGFSLILPLCVVNYERNAYSGVLQC